MKKLQPQEKTLEVKKIGRMKNIKLLSYPTTFKVKMKRRQMKKPKVLFFLITCP